MNDSSLVYILFFTSAVLMVLFVHRYYYRDYKAKRQVNRRLSLIEQTGNQAGTLAILQRERGIVARDSWYALEGLLTLFVQSGLRIRGMYFLSAIGGLFAIVTAVMTFVFGFGLILLNVVVALASTMILTLMFVGIKRQRRILRFNEQLPDVLDVIVRSLKAGHPLPVSLALVTREMPDPAGTEFGIASDEITYGSDISSALENLSRRVGDPDLLFVVMSATIQAQTGGNLSEILARLSKLIRDRFKLRRKIHSLTAEGRFSALALTFMPVGLFGVVSLFSPAFYSDVWNEPAFRITMVVAFVMLVVGNFVMRRLANFKF
jgi:tight adherence protein B